MIGYWHNPVVCPSVALSVCDAVHCNSKGWCTGLKVVPTDSSNFLFVRLDTFVVECIDYPQNAPQKRAEENA